MRQKDALTRFLIESAEVRGHLVQMDNSWEEARNRVDYPVLVQQALGESFAAAVLLASTIKFDGKMTFQIRGSGAIHLLVVQVTADRKVRGLAKWSDLPEDNSLATLFGEDARLMITIEADRSSEPYQGIVSLTGNSISEALQHYFEHSEQLETEFFLSVGVQCAAGLMLQKLPGTSAEDDGWNRAVQLAKTLTAEELVELDASTLVHRLYHQETVRLFEPGMVTFECSCSRQRTDGLITGLGKAEADSILEEQGRVEVICEFCAEEYRYDAIDVATLFSVGSTDTDPDSNTLH